MPRRRGEEHERIRAFFALEIGDGARRAVAALVRELGAAEHGKNVRWVREENLHVTLRFLGNVGADLVPTLVEGAREASRGLAPFELAIGGFSWLGRRVAVLDVGPAEPLEALAGAAERAAVAAGLPPERRPFRSHLTLGRVRRRPLPAVTSAVTAVTEPFRVEEMVLFQSRLQPAGAKYTPLERIPIGGA